MFWGRILDIFQTCHLRGDFGSSFSPQESSIWRRFGYFQTCHFRGYCSAGSFGLRTAPKDACVGANWFWSTLLHQLKGAASWRTATLKHDHFRQHALDQKVIVHRENLCYSSTCRHIYQSLAWWCLSTFAKCDQRMANLCEGVSWTYYSWWNSHVPAVNRANSRCAYFASREAGDKTANSN